MAARIVSWGESKHIISPVNSSEPSIVSIDSIQTSLSSEHMSSVLTEPSGSEKLTAVSTYPRADAADTSFERHQKYFFKDGNVTFLVDGTLYCVHRYFFSRDSKYFSIRFAQLGIHDHEALPITISLGNTDRKDFDAFLSILYPEDFEQNNLSYNEWRSVLHLSTQWDFASIRRLALNNIQPPSPHDQLLLARAYSVDHWVTPALSALCERSAPLGLDEARQMNIEDVVLVATVREDVRNRTLRVDAAQIPRLVEIAQTGKLVRVDSVEVPLAVPTSGAVEQALSPVAEKRASKDYDTEGADGEVLEHPGTPAYVGDPVEDGGEVVVGREVEAEDAWSTRWGAPNHTAEEEAARHEVYAEAMRRAADAEAARCVAEEEALRCLAEAEVAKHEAEAEAAKREAEAEVAKCKAEAEAAKRKAEVEAAQRAAQHAARAEAKNNRARSKANAEATLKAEAEAKRAAETEAAKRAAEAKAAKRAAEAETVWRVAEAEAARCMAEAEAARHPAYGGASLTTTQYKKKNGNTR